MASGRVLLKTDTDLAGIREAADVVRRVLTEVASLVAPGVATTVLNDAAEEVIDAAGGRPAFKGYKMGGVGTAFPGALCISVDDVVVHGFPTQEPLREGQIVSVDCGVELGGYFGDFAYTFAVGEISDAKRALLDATKASLYAGIEAARVGNRVEDISHAVQTYCESRGYGVVHELVGHGVGKRLHEAPNVPNVGRRGRGKKLVPGMTLCIEPMINGGTSEVTVGADGWTVRTADGAPSAHYEHMVHIQKGRPEVLSSFDSIEAALAAPRGEALPAAA